ncbi:hypothetical protein TNCV_4001851 [Trichonephila clavipes]|uniref:Uncharacterized protein n=1 Tax=Trichonephila clavipes TaxID=2585209 RepID=A0A8X6UZ61_TRICX|nr:hypothetical protein TNCV_4001851 [Trichonephila clavipes]
MIHRDRCAEKDDHLKTQDYTTANNLLDEILSPFCIPQNYSTKTSCDHSGQRCNSKAVKDTIDAMKRQQWCRDHQNLT